MCIAPRYMTLGLINSRHLSSSLRTPHETSWVPMLWAVNLLQTERTSGRLKVEATIYSNILNSFEYIENCNRKIFNHGWVNFPFGEHTYKDFSQHNIFSVQLIFYKNNHEKL